jgi:glycosyltransferase involved in cell wall biosynthesis
VARVLVLRQYLFDDVRVSREIRALISAGHEVDIVCVAGPGEPYLERRGPLTIRRLPFSEKRAGVTTYLARYGGFLLVAMALACVLHLRRRYDLVQANSLPDTIVFAALAPKLLRTPVLLDLQETMPEFFATKFGRPMDSRPVKLVGAAEQSSIRFADHVITCTDQMRDAFVGRGADPGEIDVILNSTDESRWDPDHPPTPLEGFTLICHGTMEDRYGLDTLVEATALLRDEIPDLRVRIYGDGPFRPRLLELIRTHGLEDRIWVADGYVPYDELIGAIAGADVGIVAMKRDAFRDLTHCNKMFDFITMGVPAAVSRTMSVEAYFDEDSFGWFESANAEDLARAVRELHADPDRRRRLVEHARSVAEPYRWPHQREHYLSVVDRLLARRL